ncbi:hypothetical protein LXL04_006172 [Taraxacum kok-saghyz]
MQRGKKEFFHRHLLRHLHRFNSSDAATSVPSHLSAIAASSTADITDIHHDRVSSRQSAATPAKGNEHVQVEYFRVNKPKTFIGIL